MTIPELAEVGAAIAAVGFPILAQLARVLQSSGAQGETLRNLQASIAAIHVRMDEKKKEDRETFAMLAHDIRENHSELSAEVWEIREALAGADIHVANGATPSQHRSKGG